jgi:hypothetical protein
MKTWPPPTKDEIEIVQNTLMHGTELEFQTVGGQTVYASISYNRLTDWHATFYASNRNAAVTFYLCRTSTKDPIVRHIWELLDKELNMTPKTVAYTKLEIRSVPG